uniref:Uncharacterized protein n=1 Tax=Steinernema glaseri TaxID=37863 RepID=A0A1I7Y7C4_9BILA
MYASKSSEICRNPNSHVLLRFVSDLRFACPSRSLESSWERLLGSEELGVHLRRLGAPAGIRRAWIPSTTWTSLSPPTLRGLFLILVLYSAISVTDPRVVYFDFASCF